MESVSVTDVTKISNVTDVKNGTAVLTFVPIQYGSVSTAIVSCVLSMLGSALVIYTFVHFQDFRSTSRKILVYLSVVTGVSSVAHIATAAVYLNAGVLSGSRDLRCLVPVAVAVYADVSAALWTSCLSVYLYITIVWSLITIGNRLIWLFHLLSWTIPGAITLLVVVNDAIGYHEALVSQHGHPSWCRVRQPEPRGVRWVYLAGPAWDLAAYCITLPLFVLICVHLYRQRHEGPISVIQSANRRLRFVGLLFILIRIWGTIRFLVMFNDRSRLHSKWGSALLILQAAGDNSQGFANAVLLCWCTKRIRQRLIRTLPCLQRSFQRNRRPHNFRSCVQRKGNTYLDLHVELIDLNSAEANQEITT